MASYKSAYTGTQIDTAIGKAINDVYTKAEVDSAIATANQKTGTWTPILVNYTDDMHPNVVVDPTYTVDYSNAHYLKMGKLVHISFRIDFLRNQGNLFLYLLVLHTFYLPYF